MINVPTRVKDALKSGMYPKNHRIVVLNEDDTELFTIDNNSLVDGSVSYDERLCTGDTLKFGLCEGSSLQFQYFGHESILGRRLQCFIDAQYKDADGELKYFEIPMGFYDVKQCPMQFDTGVKKVTAYNKLKSEYLDADATETVKELVAIGEPDITADKITMYTLLNELLEGYSIFHKSYSNIKSRFSGDKSYNVESTRLCDAQGNLDSYYLNVFRLSVTMSLTKSEFYKFFIYGKDIKANSKTVWNGYRNRYTKLGNQVYTITEAAETIYSIGYALSGQWALYANVGEPTAKVIKSAKCGEDYETKDYTSLFNLSVSIPVYVTTSTSANPSITTAIKQQMDEGFARYWNDFNFADVYQLIMGDIEKYTLTTQQVKDMQKVTLRELQSAVYEMNCQYGQLDRETDLFSGISLSNERLFPSESLYPSDNLYPGGKAEHIMRSNYEKLWTDAQGIQKFKELIITYKGLNAEGQEEEKTLTRTIDADGTQNYNMSDNWLFKNLVWTAEEVGHYADAMVEKMRNVTWFPFEMWAAGLPYIETGDELEITTQSGTYTSYVLTRTLNGIHDLHDTYINGTLDVF